MYIGFKSTEWRNKNAKINKNLPNNDSATLSLLGKGNSKRTSTPTSKQDHWISYQFSSVHFSCSVVSDSLQPHGLRLAWHPCPSPVPRVYSKSCPLSRWCHPTISSSVVSLSSLLQPFPASGSFPMNQLFTSGGQSIGISASASVLPVNIQDWFPLGWTGWISLQSKGLLQHHSSKASILWHSAFFIVQLSHPYMTTGKTMALTRDPGSIPRLGRSPGEGNGYPLSTLA